MGTGFDVNLSQQEEGIIPRAVHQLFEGIQSRRMHGQGTGAQPPEFKVSAQFLEVGNICNKEPMYHQAALQSYTIFYLNFNALTCKWCICVCVYGCAGMCVHINSNQMGQNKGMNPLFHKQEVTTWRQMGREVCLCFVRPDSFVVEDG